MTMIDKFGKIGQPTRVGLIRQKPRLPAAEAPFVNEGTGPFCFGHNNHGGAKHPSISIVSVIAIHTNKTIPFRPFPAQARSRK